MTEGYELGPKASPRFVSGLYIRVVVSHASVAGLPDPFGAREGNTEVINLGNYLFVIYGQMLLALFAPGVKFKPLVNIYGKQMMWAVEQQHVQL